MKKYYDGNLIKKYKLFPFIEGFTTNLSFASQCGGNYKQYIEDYIAETDNKPCSFQVWSDNDEDIINQAIAIHSMGENVYVKISIIKCNGSYNQTVIKKLLDMNIKINITVVHTKKQINSIVKYLNYKTPTIISIFAGGITDAGVDPVNIVKYAIDRLADYKNVEILWAGCQTNLHIINADKIGCHIITIPDSILDKMDRMDNNLEITSIIKINKFMKDGKMLWIH